MGTDKKAGAEGRKGWLQAECEAPGIAYLGELRLPRKEKPDAFFSMVPRQRIGFAQGAH